MNERHKTVLLALFDGFKETPEIAKRVGFSNHYTISVVQYLRDLGLVEKSGIGTFTSGRVPYQWRVTPAGRALCLEDRPNGADAAAPVPAPLVLEPVAGRGRDNRPAFILTPIVERKPALARRVNDFRSYGVLSLGEPEPGRSALDQRRAGL